LPEVARAAALVSVQDRSFKDALASAATRALPELSPADVTTLVAAMGDLGIYSVAFKDAIADRVSVYLSFFLFYLGCLCACVEMVRYISLLTFIALVV
jgi:hypothetical protein